MDEILPCPFCGGGAFHTYSTQNYHRLYEHYVVCKNKDDCGAVLGPRYGEGTAEAAWNTRAEPVYDQSVVKRLATQMGWTPPSASPALLTDEQIIALADRGEYLTPSPSKYPEAGHGTQYHCGAPGLLGFARALLAAQPAADARGEVVVTWDESRTRILAVTRQDKDGKILSVLAEAAEPAPLERQGVALSEQEAFEAWAKEHTYNIGMLGGVYAVMRTVCAWAGWQARASSSRAEVEKDSERLTWLIDEEAIIASITVTGGLPRYHVEWPSLYEQQSEYFADPRAAIDAAMLAAAEAPNKDKP